MARLELTREQILAYRRRVGALDERMPMATDSLRRAAWAGLQDSMPRAAVLSLHARVAGVEPSTWEHPSFAQLWGPRYQTYVVPARDFALFSIGRLPDNEKGRKRAVEMAERVRTVLADRRMPDREVGRALGMNSNAFRYAAPTGTDHLDGRAGRHRPGGGVLRARPPVPPRRRADDRRPVLPLGRDLAWRGGEGVRLARRGARPGSLTAR